LWRFVTVTSANPSVTVFSTRSGESRWSSSGGETQRRDRREEVRVCRADRDQHLVGTDAALRRDLLPE
jgi:hypothetical protein